MIDSTKNSSPAVSIIVPVYNVVQYLPQCLDSLINQTLKNIEIIVIDDGSTDGSEKICDEYGAKYSFIKVVHQPNTGLSAARKTGMTLITGEYCGFCDSDDFVSSDYFADLYQAAQQNNADVVQAGYTMYYGPDDATPGEETRTIKTILRYKGKADKLRETMLLCPSLIWRRIHKTALLRQYDIDFDPNIRMAEDLHFSCQTLLTAEKFAVIDNPGYFYRQNRDGRLTFVGDERMMDLFWLFDKIDNFIKQKQLCKPYALSHLSVNIPLHQIYRVDINLRNQYVNELLNRLTLKCWFRYVISGIIFSIRMRFIKYFILNWICANTLIVTSLTRPLRQVAYLGIKATLFFRQGEIIKRLKL